MFDRVLRALIGAVVLLVAFGPSNVEAQSADRALDPPPDLPSSQQMQERRKQDGIVKHDVPFSASGTFPRRLSAYRKGDPRNVKSAGFAEGVAADLLSIAALDTSPIHVNILGTADGIPNSGVNYDLAALPPDCRTSVTSPIDDPELALLRACVMREQIHELLGTSNADIFWARRTRDEIDVKRSGDAYRYVEVEAFR